LNSCAEWLDCEQDLQIGRIGARSVVIVTYQRCGSSFLGQLFNSNRRAFYMFEPLDALYSAMYGTQPGYNVPSDIATYSNGTERCARLCLPRLPVLSRFRVTARQNFFSVYVVQLRNQLPEVVSASKQCQCFYISSKFNTFVVFNVIVQCVSSFTYLLGQL